MENFTHLDEFESPGWVVNQSGILNVHVNGGFEIRVARLIQRDA